MIFAVQSKRQSPVKRRRVAPDTAVKADRSVEVAQKVQEDAPSCASPPNPREQFARRLAFPLQNLSPGRHQRADHFVLHFRVILYASNVSSDYDGSNRPPRAQAQERAAIGLRRPQGLPLALDPEQPREPATQRL